MKNNCNWTIVVDVQNDPLKKLGMIDEIMKAPWSTIAIQLHSTQIGRSAMKLVADSMILPAGLLITVKKIPANTAPSHSP